MSLPRVILNTVLGRFGWCIGRIGSAQEMVNGQWVDTPVPAGQRRYRLLRLRRA